MTNSFLVMNTLLDHPVPTYFPTKVMQVQLLILPGHCEQQLNENVSVESDF